MRKGETGQGHGAPGLRSSFHREDCDRQFELCGFVANDYAVGACGFEPDDADFAEAGVT
jgi:hypothetical protein